MNIFSKLLVIFCAVTLGACATSQPKRAVTDHAVKAESKSGDEMSVAMSIMRHIKRDKNLRDVEAKDKELAFSTFGSNADAVLSVGMSVTDPVEWARAGWLIDALFLGAGFNKHPIGWSFIPKADTKDVEVAKSMVTDAALSGLARALGGAGYSHRPTQDDRGGYGFVVSGNECDTGKPCRIIVNLEVLDGMLFKGEAPPVMGGYEAHEVVWRPGAGYGGDYRFPDIALLDLYISVGFGAPNWMATYLPAKYKGGDNPPYVIQGGKYHFFIRPE